MKKFLTVLLVIAVMFTFSFSSAFAGVADQTGELGLAQAKAEAKAVVATYNMADYAGSNLVSFTSYLNDFNSTIDGLTEVASVTNLVNAFVSYTNALSKTDAALNALREKYADKLAAYEDAINWALYVEATSTQVNYLGTSLATTSSAIFANAETEAEMKALYAYHKGEIDSLASKVVGFTNEYSTSIASNEYKVYKAQEVRKYVAKKTVAANYSFGVKAKINALADEAVAKINAATTVAKVDDAYEEYCGDGEKSFVFKASGLKFVKNDYGKIQAVLDAEAIGGDVTVDTIADAADFVDFIEANYTELSEIQVDKWASVSDLYAIAQDVANGNTWVKAASGTSYHGALTAVGSATDALKLLLRSQKEMASPLNLDFYELYETTPSNVYSAPELSKYNTAKLNYDKGILLASKLAEVRALQAEFVAAVKDLDTIEDKDLADAIEEAKENLAVAKKTAEESVYFTDDVKAVIPVLYDLAVAEVEDYEIGEATATTVDALASLTDVSIEYASATTAVKALFYVLGHEAKGSVASATDARNAATTTNAALLTYYLGQIADNYATFTDTPDANGNYLFATGAFFDDGTGRDAFRNQTDANDALTDFIYYCGKARSLDEVVAEYAVAVAALDKLPLAATKKAEKDYSRFETAMKALADNPATGIASDKTRYNEANNALTGIFEYGETRSDLADYFTAEQVDAIYAANVTILDYMYAYELAKADPSAIVATDSVLGNWAKLKAVLTDAALSANYVVADQITISKQINTTDNAIAAGATTAEKVAAAQSGIDAILAIVPNYVAKKAANYADLLAAAKANAQKFFATYENKAFVSAANDGFQLRDEIMAGSAFDVKAAIANLKAVARSVKTSKGNIKVTVVADTTALEAAGYSVSYKFYRSTKSNKNYKAMITKKANTYTNTTGTKGVKYFYKAKLVVKDAAGNTVGTTALTQCKYACRTK